MMRSILIVLLITFLSQSAIAADASKAESPSPIKTYDDEVINAFQVMCTVEPLDFDRLSTKATAMRMKLSTDKTDKEPGAANATHRVKSFEGGLTDGPWTLLIEKIDSPTVTAVTCGVGAHVKDKAAFHSNVVTTMHLKSDGTQHTMPNGNEDTYWKDIYGPHTVFNITDIVGGDGVILQTLEAKPVTK